MKAMINNLLGKMGYAISKVEKFSGSYNPYSQISLKSNNKIIDLDALAQISLSIPGMIAPKTGQILYALCYLQELRGDVVEVGSWQGRSTSFLARAVKNSGNGRFFAIDHFRGNVDKEKYYIVKKKDLSDVKTTFLSNMKRLGLNDTVRLLDMPSEQAIKIMHDVKIRFLFIDADHTLQGVKKDILLFIPRLMKGSIIIFDDFSKNYPGLIEAVDSLMREREFSRVMSFHNTLVLVI